MGIKSKVANMPLYQLLGGKSRDAIDCYIHAIADDMTELKQQIDPYLKEGYQYIRYQIGFYGSNAKEMVVPSKQSTGTYFDQEYYMKKTIDMFKELREHYKDRFQILHDVHERLYPNQAIQFCKEVEPYRPYFIEDVFPLEQIKWYKQLKNNCSHL